MTTKELIVKSLRITLIPSIEWKIISEEQTSIKDILWGFLFPIILFSSIGRNIGLFFTVKPVLGLSLNMAVLMLFNLLAWIIIPYLLVVIASYLLNLALPKFGIESSLHRTLKLTVYTFTPVFLVTFFIYLHPLLRLLIPIGMYLFLAYTLYIFWYGIQELFKISLEKKLRFIIISVLIAFLIIFLAQHLYSLLIGFIIPGMEAYVK